MIRLTDFGGRQRGRWQRAQKYADPGLPGAVRNANGTFTVVDAVPWIVVEVIGRETLQRVHGQRRGLKLRIGDDWREILTAAVTHGDHRDLTRVRRLFDRAVRDATPTGTPIYSRNVVEAIVQCLATGDTHGRKLASELLRRERPRRSAA